MNSKNSIFRRDSANLLLTLFAILMAHNAIPHHHLECSDRQSRCEIRSVDEKKSDEPSSWSLIWNLINYSHPESLDEQTQGFFPTKAGVKKPWDRTQQFFRPFPYQKAPSYKNQSLWAQPRFIFSTRLPSEHGMRLNTPLRGPPFV